MIRIFRPSHILLAALLILNCENRQDLPGNNDDRLQLSTMVSANSCNVGGTILLKIQMENPGEKLKSGLQLHQEINGFRVVKQAKSKKVQIINGEKSETQEIQLTLLALKPGTWTIPAYKVITKTDQVYASKPIDIKVFADSGRKNKQNRFSDSNNKRPDLNSNVNNKMDI